MAKSVLIVLAVTLLALAPSALADWDPSQPAKWVQMPDRTEMGIDVDASNDFILADDFECIESGGITGVHIWGSWFNDYLPFGYDPAGVGFIISFHTDIPADQSPTGYSMPGDVVAYKYFDPGEYTVRVWDQGIFEGWLEPPEYYIFPADQVIWQYNFPFVGGQFVQEGSPDNPMVYWLDVKAIPLDQEAYFGWKTSEIHWNDDAVWGIGYEPYSGPWDELRYPPGHEMYGQSIDLAFVLVSEMDWGDAPEFPGAGGYPTTAANNGACHPLGGPWLGPNGDWPDFEPDGQPEPNALGDDMLDGNDDEDGVFIPPLPLGGTAVVTFEVSDGGSGTGGVVEGWIDFDGSLTWEASEMVVGGWYPAGVHNVNIAVPASATVGQTFSRWRITLNGGVGPVGPGPMGEVEDHEVYIEEELSKWIQRPDLTETGIDVNATELYILADDFLCTEPGRIVDIYVWGSWLNDWLPFGVDPGAVAFTLSFHSDIPADESSTGYSMPGHVLWIRDFVPGEFEFSIYAENINEGWMNPPDVYWFPADFTCWLYHFLVPIDDAFFQSGTQAHPKVYWLDVQAHPQDPDAFFGWKTSIEHWNDDAVWGEGFEPYYGPWYELRYPPNHPYSEQSIDLAFKLVMDPHSGVPESQEIPDGLGMFQNVPNPFAGSTTIRYALPAEGRVKLEVFDVSGRLVDTLVDGTQAAGMRTAVWEGRDSRGNDLPSGVYFYRLSSCNESRTMKMLLLR